MSKITSGTINCPQCQHSQIVDVYASINVKLDPELRELFLEQGINIFKCEKCGLEQPISTDLMYHDMEKGFIVYILPDGDFETKKAELNAMPSFGEIADYFKNPLCVRSYKEAMLMVHLCESNGAPKTDEDREKYYQAYKDISAIYENVVPDEQVLSQEPFDLIDAYQDEGYSWACEVLRVCGPFTGLRSDLVPYALAMIIDDFIYIVLGYPKREWEYLLDEAFGNHEEVWEQIYAIRTEVSRKLTAKIGEEAVYVSLEEMTETVDPEEPDVTIITMSDVQRLKLRDFVSDGLGY